MPAERRKEIRQARSAKGDFFRAMSQARQALKARKDAEAHARLCLARARAAADTWRTLKPVPPEILAELLQLEALLQGELPAEATEEVPDE